ncbi:hypothetical protein L9F63_002208 [Diploptera punctata]|uniref:Uncharacterized protein n=1 Tax=Diploptera punctata TaxID=6984 RepID=A0AAD8A3U7_DIPPU|nr:hypothetical protein L9F63_002208 [Diploptera punctata]
MEKAEEQLNELLEHIGMEGKFQKIFNIQYNLFLMLLVAMASINIVLALSTPEHWCLVPGRNRTNFTELQWKHFTIPRWGKKTNSYNVLIIL